MNPIEVTFPGGKRVDARCGDFVVRTDQPIELGGDGSAISPFELFLVSLATCAGYYVVAFCQARGLATDGLALRQHVHVDPTTKLPDQIRIELQLPPAFPEKYRSAVVRAAEGCKVKKTIAGAPSIDVAIVADQHAFANAS